MKEALWGVLIIGLGLLGIVIINLFQEVTITTDHTYYLLKETTKAAMEDSIDFSYYREKGKIRIVEEKFVENLTRRFAESATILKSYNIVVHEVKEEPPRVSVSIGTYAISLQGQKFNIGQTIDGIIEVDYEGEGTEPEEVVPQGNRKCEPMGVTSCINGDLRFNGWGSIKKVNICPGTKIGTKTREVNYDECECGKWVEKKEDVESDIPVQKAQGAEYTWKFYKKSEIREIDETTKDTDYYSICLTDLKLDCPGGEIQVLIGESHSIKPIYIPENAVNRKLDWSSNNTKVATVQNSNLEVGINGFDYGNVLGVGKGTAIITAKSNNNKSATCNVRVKEWKCPDEVTTVKIGQSIQATVNGLVPTNAKWGITDPSKLSINNKGILTAKHIIGTAAYTVEKEGYPKLECPVNIILDIDWECPETVRIPINSSGVIGIKDFKSVEGISFRIDNTNIATVNQTTGQVTTKGTATTINYYVNAPGYPELSCPLQVTGGTCTVGEMTGNWLDKKTLPKLCPQDIEHGTSKLYDATRMTVQPRFCSKSGQFDSCGNGRWELGDTVGFSGRGFVPESSYTPGRSVTVTNQGSTYRIDWKISYQYGGWHVNSLSCPYPKERHSVTIAYSKTGSLYVEGTEEYNKNCLNWKFELDPRDVEVTPQIGNCPGNIEMIAGTTGNVNLSAVYGPLSKYNFVRWEYVKNGLVNVQENGENLTLTPPIKTAINIGDEKTFPIKFYYTEDGIPDSVTCNIRLIPFTDCNSLYINKTPKLCANLTSKIALYYADGNAFNENSKWNITGAVKENVTNSYSLYKHVVAGKAGGKITISAEKQVGGSCTVTETVTVQPTKPVCNHSSFPAATTVDGVDYCYMSAGYQYPSVCDEASGYNLVNGKCVYSETKTCPSTYPINGGVGYCWSCDGDYDKIKSGPYGSKICVKNKTRCPSGSTWNASDKQCEESKSQNPRNPKCTPPFQVSGAVCIKPVDKESYESTWYATWTTLCGSGYTYSNGKCVYNTKLDPKCPDNMILVTTSGENRCHFYIEATQVCK